MAVQWTMIPTQHGHFDSADIGCAYGVIADRCSVSKLEFEHDLSTPSI